MRQPCPSCQDGNEWNSNGPTGRACQTCHGKAYIVGAREEDIGFDEEGDMGESPYCECDEIVMEEEAIAGKCFACGKQLP